MSIYNDNFEDDFDDTNEFNDVEYELEDEIEDEFDDSISNRDKGNWIYSDYSEKDLRNETLDFLSNYMKHKSNRDTIEKEIYNQSLINNVFNKDYYISLLNTFIIDLVQNGLKTAYDNLLNKKLSWNHPEFEEVKEYENKEVAKRLNPPKVQEGIFECKKCGGKQTQSYEVQLRRADEPATIFVECVNPKCRNSWKIN